MLQLRLEERRERGISSDESRAAFFAAVRAGAREANPLAFAVFQELSLSYFVGGGSDTTR